MKQLFRRLPIDLDYFSYLCMKKQEDMASNADFVQYIADQCSGAGEMVAKKMFGDYGIYCDGK